MDRDLLLLELLRRRARSVNRELPPDAGRACLRVGGKGDDEKDGSEQGNEI